MFRSSLISCFITLALTASLTSAATTAGANAKPGQQAQSAEASSRKILSRQLRFSNEPVQIIHVRVKGQSVRLGNKPASFNEGNDWLRGLVVRFKNVSDKPVSSVEFHLALAEPGLLTNLITFTLKYGTTRPSRSADPSELLMPGATAEVVLSEAWYDQANESLRQSHNSLATMVDRANLELSCVYFDDGTAWHSGSLGS